MNEKQRAFLKNYRISYVFPVIAVFLAVSFTVGMNTEFDYSIAHFEWGSLAHASLIGFSLIAAVIAVILSLGAQKSLSVADSPTNDMLALFGFLFAAVSSAGAFVQFIAAIPPLVTFAYLAEGALYPLITVYSVYSALSYGKKTQGTLGVLLTLGALSATLSLIFAVYFDLSYAINSEVRNTNILILASAIFFFISEARLALGKKAERVTAQMYVFSSALTSSFGIGLTLGGIIHRLTFSGTADHTLSLLPLATFLGISVVGLSRLLSLSKIAGEYIPKTPKNGSFSKITAYLTGKDKSDTSKKTNNSKEN